MTASLPGDVQGVFQRFITTEYTTIDRSGQPITWPVSPYYEPGGACIDVTTGLGYPKKASDARTNPLVALLFSDPTGSGIADAPMVLVQGTADVDDRDLDANRRRYVREASAKLPAITKMMPPDAIQKRMSWYFARLYVHVRPERVYAWPRGDLSAVLSIVSPDGFRFAVRVPVRVDSGARLIRLEADPESTPVQPGLACLTAHRHAPDFSWQTNFQVRGDLQRDVDGWVLAPHKLVGGLELPKSKLASLRANFGKARRYHRVAKRELARRGR